MLFDCTAFSLLHYTVSPKPHLGSKQALSTPDRYEKENIPFFLSINKVAAPVERRRFFHCYKGHLSSWKCKIVVNAVFLTCGTFISGFKTFKNYWRRASKWTFLGFRYSEMMIFGKIECWKLVRMWQPELFLSVAQKRSLAVADLAVEWLHEHAKFFQEIETTSNFAMFWLRCNFNWSPDNWRVENFHSVTLIAYEKLQENVHSVASRAWLKIQETSV